MIYVSYAIIIMIVLILLFILIARLRIVIRYVRLDGKELFNLRLLLLGNIIKINIQVDNIINRYQKKERKIKHKKIEPQKRIDFDYLKKILENIQDYYYIINKILKTANKYYKKRLICEEFTFIIDFGLEDAAITGIASGFTYGIIYNILSIINNNMILKS